MTNLDFLSSSKHGGGGVASQQTASVTGGVHSLLFRRKGRRASLCGDATTTTPTVLTLRTSAVMPKHKLGQGRSNSKANKNASLPTPSEELCLNDPYKHLGMPQLLSESNHNNNPALDNNNDNDDDNMLRFVRATPTRTKRYDRSRSERNLMTTSRRDATAATATAKRSRVRRVSLSNAPTSTITTTTTTTATTTTARTPSRHEEPPRLYSSPPRSRRTSPSDSFSQRQPQHDGDADEDDARVPQQGFHHGRVGRRPSLCDTIQVQSAPDLMVHKSTRRMMQHDREEPRRPDPPGAPPPVPPSLPESPRRHAPARSQSGYEGMPMPPTLFEMNSSTGGDSTVSAKTTSPRTRRTSTASASSRLSFTPTGQGDQQEAPRQHYRRRRDAQQDQHQHQHRQHQQGLLDYPHEPPSEKQRSHHEEYHHRHHDHHHPTAVPSPLSIEIAPGITCPLRGAAETWAAVARDYYVPLTCLECRAEICCVLDAAYVVCPKCRTVSPLPDCGMPAAGVGLGFTLDDLRHMQSEIVAQQAQRTGVGSIHSAATLTTGSRPRRRSMW